MSSSPEPDAAPGARVPGDPVPAAVDGFRVVVTGVSGAGKSTVGSALAAALGVRFVEGDDLHLQASVAKMAAGEPLDDDDRWPWLVRVRRELRAGPAVVACSGLARRYRDLLRGVGGVRFVHLALDPATAGGRLGSRTGHYMGPGMVDGQFAALEPPEPDEVDVTVLDGAAPVADLVGRAAAAVSETPVARPRPLLEWGGPEADLDGDLDRMIDELAAAVLGRGPRRVLLVPPDHTRLHSRAGPITVGLLARLEGAGIEAAVLPATGTHAPMTAADARLLFGDAIGVDRLLVHRWRDGVTTLGEVPAAEVAELSGGRYTDAVPVVVDDQLLTGWDLVVSIGQVLPHEVVGMANGAKNLVIGLGGAPTIHRSHFLGAVCGLEGLMGEAVTPVRDLVDAAFDRFVAAEVEVLWVLTVVEDVGPARRLRGVFAGVGGSAGSGGAAYRAAAALAAEVGITRVVEPWRRVSCWLDPSELRSTWLGNKAVYRTRCAIADGGELVVLAPGVTTFGEDPAIDVLIRRHGYRGTDAALAAVAADPELAANLGAAAHLIHGSSEGRFTVTYCTDPGAGGLTRDEVEAVGYRWRPLDAELARLGVDGDTPSGPRRDREGEPFVHVQNPALGLWRAAGRPETGAT